MKTLITLIILLFLTSFQTFAQFDYEVYEALTSKESLGLNRKTKKRIEFQSEKGGEKTKISTRQFLKSGFPEEIIQFDKEGMISIKKNFVYTSDGILKSIETFKNGTHEASTEFMVNQTGNIVNYTEYVYSSYDGEKTLLWKTFLDYNPNGTLKEKVKLEESGDTSEVNFYDESGSLIKTLYNMSGLRTTKIEYLYSKDSTTMLEKHYEDKKKVYLTITHRYKDKKEIERTDTSISEKPFYWKYDKNGKVIETNENFFYILYFKYDSEGRLTNKTVEVLFSDSDEKDLPKKIDFFYEYDAP